MPLSLVLNQPSPADTGALTDPGSMLIVFTDLDGTLLDPGTYSFEPARAALMALERSGIPLVFCTSKTRAETEVWRERTGNKHPFIVENGSAVFVPEGYFRMSVDTGFRSGGFAVIELGRPYLELRSYLSGTGLPIRGFGDMDVGEISRVCGFSMEEAEAASDRGYDEPFIMTGGEKALAGLVRDAAAAGFKIVRGGRFLHLMGAGAGKGRAVGIVRDLYEREYGTVETAALGDSLNDMDMLAAADRAFLIRKGDGTYETMDIPGLARTPGAGPAGWAEAVTALLVGVGQA